MRASAKASRRLTLLCAIALALGLPDGGATAQDVPDPAAVARSLVDNFVLPRHAALVSATAEFESAARSFCAAPASLIAEHRPGRGIALLDIGRDALDRLDGYCGSAALDGSGRYLAVSSPRGGWAIFWDRAEGRVAGEVALPDVCGLAPAGPPGLVLLTSGQGGALLHDAATGRSTAIAAALVRQSHWDNHVFAAP